MKELLRIESIIFCEVSAEEKAGLGEQFFAVQEKRDVDAGDAAVAIHKGMDDQKLTEENGELDERLFSFSPHIALQGLQVAPHLFCSRRMEERLLNATPFFADPILPLA